MGAHLQLRTRAAGDGPERLGGNPAAFAAGQKALATRAKLNGLAAGGSYKTSMESAAA